jgi:RNA polymerase sigma factor (sigma-70 family)
MADAQLTVVLCHLRRLAGVRQVEDLSDGQLLARFVSRQDEAAFAALVERHSGLVMGVCRRVLHHRHDAEDAFQATFLVLAQKAGAIRNREAVGGWLYEVAYHIAARARAQAARRRSSERQATPMPPDDPPAETVWPELRPVLDEELHRLPEKYRLPLVLCYLQGKSNREAAAELGWPVGSISRRLARARELLRHNLTRRGVALSGALLATVLAGAPASAAVPPAFLNTTVKAALLMAAGRGAAGAASAQALILAQGVLKSMFLSKLKSATSLLLVMGVLALAALTRPAAAQKQPAQRPALQGPSVKSSSPVAKKGADDPKPAEGKMTVAGRVLKADGKPASGADVAVVNNLKVTLPSWEMVYPQKVLGRAKADEQGRFRLTVPRTSSMNSFGVNVWAIAKGSALVTQQLNPDAARHQVTLKLAAPRMVRVRLVDLQGEPAAKVRIETGWNPIAPFEQGPVTTNAEGRATVRADFVSGAVMVRDDRFARQDFWVRAADRQPAKEVTFALAPAKWFTGRVTRADTGKPLAGAVVKIATNSKGGLMPMFGRTDAQGRYRLNPYTGTEFWVQVYAPEGEPYLSKRKILTVAGATARKDMDFALPRGVLVKGKVTEQASGKPVAEAAVVYRPHFENPNRLADVVTGWTSGVVSGADGSFRVAVYPGKGHLLVSSTTPEFLHVEISENLINRGKPGGKRLYPEAYVPLDIPRKAREHSVAVKFRRGVTVEGELVGPDGKPVKGALVLSPLKVFMANSPEWRAFPERAFGSRFRLPGCDPDRPVTVHFLEPKQKLGATVKVSAKEARGKPLTVKLEPCVSARVRVVDGAGKPLAGQTPHLLIMVSPGASSADFDAQMQGQPAADEDFVGNFDRVNYTFGEKTDARGRITFPALIPGATYRVQLIVNGRVKVFKAFTVKAGKTLELPDIVIGEKK